jgi:hypothetical protein
MVLVLPVVARRAVAVVTGSYTPLIQPKLLSLLSAKMMLVACRSDVSSVDCRQLPDITCWLVALAVMSQ